MGRDAYVHINKAEFSVKAIEEFVFMMGFQKRNGFYVCAWDDEYKYYSPVSICKTEETETELIYYVRTQSFASSYDIQKQNETLRNFRKYCHAWFESDMGKNRYFEVGQLIKGAENGCYFAVANLENSFSLLSFSLSKYPPDNDAELTMRDIAGFPSPNAFNANVYLSYLCTLMEEYFRETYTALLKYSDRKEKVLNTKLSSVDLVEISKNKRSVEEAFARTLSFQNIYKITSNFKDLDQKIDLAAPLKKPYQNKKGTLFEILHNIFERRHGMIHRNKIDPYYNCETLGKDIEYVKISIERVYSYICQQNGWTPQEFIL